MASFSAALTQILFTTLMAAQGSRHPKTVALDAEYATLPLGGSKLREPNIPLVTSK